MRAINILGLRLYALIQRYVFWIGMACVAITLIMLLIASHNDFVTNLNTFMSDNYGTPNAYDEVIKAGGTTDTSFSLWATMLGAVFLSLFLAFPHWGVMQGGEIKRADSLRTNIYCDRRRRGVQLCRHRDLRRAADRASSVRISSTPAGGCSTAAADSPLPVPPFFGFFVALASGPAIFIWIAFIMFFCWYIMLAPNAPLGATRVMLAMSFDGVFPAWFGRVNPRTHTPVNSTHRLLDPCIAVSALYAYWASFVELTVALASRASPASG